MILSPCPYGSHRAGGGLPQPAERLDASMQPVAGELRVDVELLNIDSSSMRQMAEAAGGSAEGVAARITEIVAARGKMHNPVTRSGGCLVGRLAAVGDGADLRGAEIGDRICPIVSLSLIPIRLDAIHRVDIARAQVAVTGSAILFQTATFGVLPGDFSTAAALAIIDVCGAPARLLRMAKPGQRVAIFGAGKAGLLSAVAARAAVGEAGTVAVFDIHPRALSVAKDLGVADRIVQADLNDPIGTLLRVEAATDGALFDVVVNVTNVTGSEGASILATRQGGAILFFGMATTFQVAALSAEGVGKDIDMIIGNGFVAGCIETAFDLVRGAPALRRAIEAAYPA
jgi:L-erythro-3,5-diaminohexanoate dehydrogenase